MKTNHCTTNNPQRGGKKTMTTKKFQKKGHKTMKANNANNKMKNDTLSITKKGLTFTFNAYCKIVTDVTTGNAMYVPCDFLVNGYLLDESDDSYFIECYERFSDSNILSFKFSAIITDGLGNAISEDAKIAWLSKSVLETITSREPDQYRFNPTCTCTATS